MSVCTTNRPSRRRPLPPGRTFFADLPTVFGMSRATLYRRYRPTDSNTRGEWARKLDIRVRPGDLALHCATVAVHAERTRLEREVFEGQLASARTDEAERLRNRSRRRPTCFGCGERAATARDAFCAACGRPFDRGAEPAS